MWENFDKFICINLKEREDRLEFMRKQFERIGLSNRMEYRITARSPKGGCYGCFESHWRAIQSAYENPEIRNLIIFEDDVVFGEGWQEIISDCAHFVQEEPGWEFLNLCGHIYFVVEKSLSHKNILNCKTTKAHAVALSRAGMERFLRAYPEPVDIGVDDVYMCLFAHSYGHKNYYSIHQTEALGTDNPWSFFRNLEDAYGAFIQNVYIPRVSRAVSRLALLLGRFPYALRPWIVSNDFSENLSSGIRIWRRKKSYSEIPWRVGIPGRILITIVGIYSALTIKTPRNISRLRILYIMMQFK